MKRVAIYAGVFAVAFGLATTQAFAAGQQMGGSEAQEMQGGASQIGPHQTTPEIISAIAEQVIGKKAQDQQGRELGQVEALATRNGQIIYVLISRDEESEDLVPIPFGNSRFDPQADALVVMDADATKIADAPSLTPDQLGQLNDPDFESKVHGYYGSQLGSPPEQSSPELMKDSGGVTKPAQRQI